MKGQHGAWWAIGAHDVGAVTVTKAQGAFACAAVSCEDMTPLTAKPADQAALPVQPPGLGHLVKEGDLSRKRGSFCRQRHSVQFYNH